MLGTMGKYVSGVSVSPIGTDAKTFYDVSFREGNDCDMVNAFDRIIIEVPDVKTAAGDYSKLLGIAAHWPQEQLEGAPLAWFALKNTVVQLQGGDREKASIRGLVFASSQGSADATGLANPLGLDLALCDGSATAGVRAEAPVTDGLLVDHLVLRTGDPQGCIDLFGGQLGIRLALDKTAPQWGGRMLFFRAGKLTLEAIAADGQPDQENAFWGIAYQCSDIEQCAAHLEKAGVSLSEIRPGRKPGTRVATVKSHCLGIPTLLVEPAI